MARDWLLPDGRARVQVNPKPAAQSPAGLNTFVREVSAVAPNAGGSAVTIVATAATIVGAFRDAERFDEPVRRKPLASFRRAARI